MNKHLLLALLLSLILVPVSHAVRVKTIYQVDVPVESQAAENRAQAEELGFAQVLTKVSGNSHILDSPDLKTKSKNAESYIDEFSYLSSSTAPYLLSLHFNSTAVNRLLRNAGIPIWGQNRPLLLGWIEYEVPGKQAEIIGSDSPSGIQTLLKQYADQRGLPFLVPMMDMSEMDQINVNDIVTMNLEPLKVASKPYSCDGILVARIFKLQQGYSFASKLVLGDDEWTWSESGDSLDKVVAALVNHVSDALAARYSTVVTNSVQSHVTLKVVSVSQEGDLAQLIQYISHLTPVSDVQPMQIEGGEVVLNISLRGSKDALIQAFTIGQKLQPISDSGGDMLAYEWNP